MAAIIDIAAFCVALKSKRERAVLAVAERDVVVVDSAEDAPYAAQ